jgi:hypothetical protein
MVNSVHRDYNHYISNSSSNSSEHILSTSSSNSHYDNEAAYVQNADTDAVDTNTEYSVFKKAKFDVKWEEQRKESKLAIMLIVINPLKQHTVKTMMCSTAVVPDYLCLKN